MLLDQTLDVLTKSVWIIFVFVLIVLFIRTLFQEGFAAAFRVFLKLRVLVTFLILLSLTALSLSLVFVEPQTVGVVVSIVQPEGLREQPERPGLNFIIPFAEQIYTYPIYWQNYTMSVKPLEGQEVGDDSIIARTYDGQEVIIDCSVIFRLEIEQVVRIHVDWQDRYIEDFIRPYVRGIVRTEVSQFTIDEVNSFKRRDLEARLDELLREELSSKGFVLDRFLLRNIKFSSVYAASVESKQVSLQQITEKQYEAEQVRQLAQGKADEVVIAAEAEAESIDIVSQAEATALQRIALAVAGNPDLLAYEYINKISPNLRVMLLPNESPYILNLPDLNDPTQPSTATTPITPTLTTPAVITPTTTITNTAAPADTNP